MSKTFRAWDVDQVWLLPPSIHDFVAAGHPAHLVRELVRSELDLSAIFEPYERSEASHPVSESAHRLYGVVLEIGDRDSRPERRHCWQMRNENSKDQLPSSELSSALKLVLLAIVVSPLET